MPRTVPVRNTTREVPVENARSGPKVVFTDKYGIEYLEGDTVLIHASSDVKLSVNYNSVGLSLGITFKASPDKVESAVPKAFSKIRDMMAPEIQKAEDSLNGRA